uniref:Fibronectin type-III domain-containing protein n=1 Tax=Amphimedon queenslandica TaxID=400682 RepID=A0A1X7TSA4_AMPQE
MLSTSSYRCSNNLSPTSTMATLLKATLYIDCADITLQPVSINATLNSTVVFSCEAVADDLSFRVNNTQATNIGVIAKGFSETVFNNGGTREAELQAIAYDHNNNTEVQCRAFTDEPFDVVFSNTTILMIQGLLNSVVDLDYSFINGSSVLLTWTAPYTLDNVPITGYYIVNGSVNITTTKKSIILSATNPDPCILNNVSVSPINDAGIGSSNNIKFYYETVHLSVPLITPPVSVVPVIDGQQISLNISINVSTICKGEYPNSFLGPVTNISSSIDNCSTIDITWTAPNVDDRVPILYYILRLYDAITGSLVDTVSITLKCTGEAPVHVTVTVMCNNGTDSSTTYLIKQKINVTGLIIVPQYQQCNISTVFSNEAGSSEPFILGFDTYPTITSGTNITIVTIIDTAITTTDHDTITVQTSPTITSPAITPVSTSFNISIGFTSLQQRQQEVPTSHNEAYEFNTLIIDNNPAYGQIGQAGAVSIIILLFDFIRILIGVMYSWCSNHYLQQRLLIVMIIL